MNYIRMVGTPQGKKTRKVHHPSIYHKLENIERSISEIHSLIKSQGAMKLPEVSVPVPEASGNGIILPDQELGSKKRTGPQLWNEFLKNYMRNQESKGRKITRAEAMKEAGVNYRAKYSLPTPKTRKKPQLQNQNQSGPVVPGSLVSLTPGRVSPARLMNAPAANTPLAAKTPLVVKTPLAVKTPVNTPTPVKANAKAPSALQTFMNTLSGRRTPNNSSQAQVQTSVTTPTSGSNYKPSNINANAMRPSPATYGYEDLGIGQNTSARRVLVNGDEYFMTDEDRALFRRSENEIGDWVGYLESGGEIRYTESPDE